MTSLIQLAFASLLMAGVALWILSYFQTRMFIRASCELLMSCAVALFWLLLLLHLVLTAFAILPAFTLIELLLVVAIIAILALLLWQAAGPSIVQSLKAQRRAKVVANVLGILGNSMGANPARAKDGLTALRDFFAGNGWTGLAPDKLADVAKLLNEALDAEGDDYTATGLYDWLQENGHGAITGDFLDKLIERIVAVLENEELTDEQRRELQRLLERMQELKAIDDTAEAGG